MKDEQFLKILGKLPRLLKMDKKEFYQWVESLTKDESKEFAKGVATEFGIKESIFLEKLLAYQILKAKPWVDEEDIDFEVLGV